MKTVKLTTHSKNDECLLINSKDFPALSIGSVIEIRSPDDCSSLLLLQVNSFSEITHRDTISLEQSVAISFQLKAYNEVIVKVVEDKKAVSLDSVEIIFKDQYLARSDMWRLKKCLVNTCVHVNKKLEVYGVRCQVLEMYIQGEKVLSGIVTDDTKIVYRSASSMVYVFIQMSSEMWHYDINGDLYFEKAIDGFLPDLFSKWKKLNCNHDVTIVLFSRTYYKAQSSDEFPPFMRECLQQDYKGRFFEDFYRVAVQNERYDDWSSTIISLKKLFNHYQDAVLKYHERPGIKIPQAVNSTSSQGNFLEVLNMSLNVFEKHYMDRSFDRTGQLSIVISPGVGVFEVDRELTIITKQRIIDNGIGSDLVCLGEQPLHAVPLFKFHNKRTAGVAPAIADDYNMPHWINLSFYSSYKQSTYATFVPRVKLPVSLNEDNGERNRKISYNSRARHCSQPDRSFPVLFDYDEHDSIVFKLPPHAQSSRYTSSLHRPRRRKATPPNQSHSVGATTTFSRKPDDALSKLTTSDPSPLSHASSHSHASSAAIAIPRKSSHATSSISSLQNSVEADVVPPQPKTYSKDDNEPEFTPPYRTIIGSAGSPYENQFAKQLLFRRPKALVNPFDPSHITIKLTSNRRRWTHVFPLGPTGIFMQQHHYQAIPQISASTLISLSPEKVSYGPENLTQYKSALSALELDGSFDSKIGVVGRKDIHSSSSTVSLSGMDAKSQNSSSYHMQSVLQAPHSNNNLSWLWGPTGEQEWTPALTTGVDWKSLVIPACLPITTDYFPDRRSLQNDYVLSEYLLFPEDIIAENTRPRYHKTEDDAKFNRTSTTLEVYYELICQRLQQGFQLILLSKQHSSYPRIQAGFSTSPQFANFAPHAKKTEQHEECLLSIGRLFHRLTLDGRKITVVQYRPRHPYREIKIHYCYRFHAPDSDTYGVSWVDFMSEKLENYGWNYLDNYICMKGEGEFELKDTLKFWRLRMLLLPGGQMATRKIIDGHPYCDLYEEFSPEDKIQQAEGFLKFIEVMNKIRRLASKTPKLCSVLPPRRSSLGQTMLSQQAPPTTFGFRDRVSSNRIHDRPRIRSLSARMGARVELPAPTGRVSPAMEVVDIKASSSNSSMEGLHESGEPTENIKLDLLSTHQEILDIMKKSQEGLNFLLKLGLPNCTFISGEAVFWAIRYIEGINTEHQAVQMFRAMLAKGLICHASGVKDHPFIHGFYLYYIVPSGEKESDKGMMMGLSKSDCIYMFQRDWIEVELSPILMLSQMDPSSDVYHTPDDFYGIQRKTESKLEFKNTNIQIDESTKSNRLEWGQAKYHSIFEPYEAFEIVVEWMVATGNIAAEKVQGWARKAYSCNLQLVPIPSDPFALPFSNDSDPLRGPIFIPLDLSCLDSFEQREDSIFILQEKILFKFGFLRYSNTLAPSPHRYAHVTGSMFVMLPIREKEIRRPCERYSQALDFHNISSPHDEYITRHFSGVKSKCNSSMNDSDSKIGFLYSWNYMITKRWKTAGTVDENFMRKVMRDFRAFCANDSGRLKDFCKYLLVTEMCDRNLLPFLET